MYFQWATIPSLTLRVYLHSFSRLVAKSREIPQKFDLTAVQGYPRSSILVSIESAYVTSY